MNCAWDENVIDFDEKEYYHRDLNKWSYDRYYSDYVEKVIRKNVRDDKHRAPFFDIIRGRAKRQGFTTIAGICKTVTKNKRISNAQMGCLIRFCCNYNCDFKGYDRA